MKKLFLFLCFGFVTGLQAFTKHDLQKAITSIDVSAVEQILEYEKLTPREYHRYLDLAEEVVRNREAWVRALQARVGRRYDFDIPRDVTTPYDETYEKRAIMELFLGCMVMMLSTVVSINSGDADEKKGALVAAIGASITFALFAKAGYDNLKAKRLHREHEELLRKKYDDAIAIKQLIFGAELIEA